MGNIKVIKTSVNQTIQVELPEGYIVDDAPPSLNTFLGEFKIHVVKVKPTLQEEKQ